MAFDQAKANAVAERISCGEPMVQICKDLRIGYRTVFRWMDENPSFAADIARARDIGADAIADEAFTIADSGNMDDTNRARLRVDTRLKLLAKWNPKRYGDRVQVDQDTRLRIELIDPRQTQRQAQRAALQGAPSAAALVQDAAQSAPVVARLVQESGEDP